MTEEQFDSKGRPVIVLDNPDGTELFDTSGRPYKVVAGGITLSGGSAAIDSVQSLTVASGAIEPSLPDGVFANVAVTGEGDTDDELTAITAGVTFSGKMILLRKAGAGNITVKKSYSLLLAADCVLNHVDDVLCLEWKSAGIWREHYRCSCG
ncbi:MAG: hypothetical protein JXA46_04675 [Dehalococcoidales bacterium]|nr:hypothetical protein [Dehalococcoidales bacterium]